MKGLSNRVTCKLMLGMALVLSFGAKVHAEHFEFVGIETLSGDMVNPNILGTVGQSWAADPDTASFSLSGWARSYALGASSPMEINSSAIIWTRQFRQVYRWKNDGGEQMSSVYHCSPIESYAGSVERSAGVFGTGTASSSIQGLGSSTINPNAPYSVSGHLLDGLCYQTEPNGNQVLWGFDIIMGINNSTGAYGYYSNQFIKASSSAGILVGHPIR